MIRKLSSFILTRWGRKTKRERKECFILQHLVQSAPWGWIPMGGLPPVEKESGGFEPALFFYSMKNVWELSALWMLIGIHPTDLYSLYCTHVAVQHPSIAAKSYLYCTSSRGNLFIYLFILGKAIFFVAVFHASVHPFSIPTSSCSG